jgi:hypothetical protein
MRVGRLGQPDTHDLGAGDRDPVVDGVEHVCLLLRLSRGLELLAEGAEPLDRALDR